MKNIPLFNSIVQLVRTLFARIAQNDLVYRVAHRLVSDHDGENNADISTNGELRALRRYISSWKTVFDIGANEGEWMRLALTLNPTLQVHCFEPNTAAYKMIMAGNVPEQVTVNHCAMGATLGSKELLVYSDASVLNSFYARESASMTDAKRETVNVDTISNYCKKHAIDTVDFVKIDVEGHELEVLKGALPMLEHGAITMIQFEYGGTFLDSGISLKAILELVKPFPYDLYKIRPFGLQRIPGYTALLENYHYANYLLIKREQ